MCSGSPGSIAEPLIDHQVPVIKLDYRQIEVERLAGIPHPDPAAPW
jgi:hypothetical protein